MTSEHQDPSRRKHRRNSGDESEEPSKRRKHRHHHRHHRHHRHSSRKHEENETIPEEETKVEQEDGDAKSLHPDLVPVHPAVNSSWRPDYDMEEGEIVEDGDLGCGGEEIEDRKRNSDVESGEIKAIEVENDLDKRAAGVREGQDSRINTHLRKEPDSRSNPISDSDLNGDKVRETSKLNNNHNPSRSPSPEGSNKKKSRYAREIEIKNNSKSLPSENSLKKHKNSPSSSLNEKLHDEVHISKRSRSRDHTRERSRSQSILQEASLVQPEQRDLLYYADKKQNRGSEEERMSRHNRDYRRGSRDLSRDEEREHSSSYRHRSREIREKDRDYRRGSRDLSRDEERERNSSYRHHSREIREKDRDREREKETERERESTREREKGRERERESTRERERERESTREREREREDREREREKEREDRDREREREKEREDRERKRGSGRDTNREKESDRIGRDRRYYDDVDDRRGDRDRYRRLNETNYRNRSGEIDEQKVNNSSRKDYSADKEKHRREEVEQEDYQDKIVLQLAEQEEEDVNRIKEESRRRRQAIIDKYKAQELRQQQESPSVDTVNEKKKESLQPQAAENVGQEEAAKITGVDVTSFSVGKSPPQNGIPALEMTTGTRALGEGTPKSEGSADMYCDDIFGESPAGVRKPGRGDGLAIERSGLNDNWDDAEGYYSYRFGEILDARYEVIAAHGKGVFSTVVRARDIKAGPEAPEVAIKIIRNNDTMYKAGLEELVILKKLVGADPEDKRHCVRFLSSFKYRNHLCLVFESLHMNLREVLKKFGRNIGLSLIAVQVYAKQLFTALKHLRNCGVLHCDIKPDNMLVNNAKNVLKLCDFGNAMFAGKNEITPYLVSRFYRAPEIILGLPYDHPMDIWSVGCCLFELYTGKVLFPGPSNNDMLRLHMELKGPFPKKMLRKGAFTEKHFDQDLNFLATEEDPVTKKTIKRLILNIKPKDIGSIVSSSSVEDPKMVINFKDLLEKIFVLDPDKRITVSQALSHPFITSK